MVEVTVVDVTDVTDVTDVVVAVVVVVVAAQALHMDGHVSAASGSSTQCTFKTVLPHAAGSWIPLHFPGKYVDVVVVVVVVDERSANSLGSSTVSCGVGGAFCSPALFFKVAISAACRAISVAWRAPIECHNS